MSAPQVYKAITAIAAELSGAGIPKRHRNERDDYRYRSIDECQAWVERGCYVNVRNGWKADIRRVTSTDEFTYETGNSCRERATEGRVA